MLMVSASDKYISGCGSTLYRNIALIDETTYCEVLVKEDAVTPLLALVNEVSIMKCIGAFLLTATVVKSYN